MPKLTLQSFLYSLVIVCLFACDKHPALHDLISELNNHHNLKTHYGPSVAMGNGSVRSWISVDPAGKPVELGMEMTDAALKGLPGHETDHPEFVLALPTKALDLTPFKHFVINWNPHGHPLAGIYDVPHFDFHFYMITNAVRQTIGPDPGAPPPPGHLPAGFVPAGPVPLMGMHWADPTAPEFNGVPFTYTMIYGSFNGAVHFTEPMITLAIMQSGKSYKNIKIQQPQIYSPSNTYHPQYYNIYMDHATKKHYVTYTGFTKR